MEKTDWYKDWFNSPYYHILYKNRDYNEAEKFISNLLNYLHLVPESNVLDLACGKGRHSIFLSKNNLIVTGLDLASNSIAEANQFKNERLKFHVHDMREPFGQNEFDAIFNLFTSFGYFCNEADDEKVIQNISSALKTNGKIVLDYLNCKVLEQCLFQNEIKFADGIEFKISKRIENNHVIKSIQFTHNGNEYNFAEKVKLISMDWFQSTFSKHGIEIKNIFGNYDLERFTEKSDRLILIGTKK